MYDVRNMLTCVGELSCGSFVNTSVVLVPVVTTGGDVAQFHQ